MADPSYTVDEAAAQTSLGIALAALRHRRGLTQEQLAARLGIDPTYVSQIERGRRGVRWNTVVRFLTALEATIQQLGDEIAAADGASYA